MSEEDLLNTHYSYMYSCCAVTRDDTLTSDMSLSDTDLCHKQHLFSLL